MAKFYRALFYNQNNTTHQQHEHPTTSDNQQSTTNNPDDYGGGENAAVGVDAFVRAMGSAVSVLPMRCTYQLLLIRNT